jgi:D-alanine-D-alanine ligase
MEEVTMLPDPTRPGLYALRDTDLGQVLKRLASFDVVFPVLHGTFGEDGTLQGLLEMACVAYVGAGVLGSALGMDKGVFKDVMRANHIPVIEYLVVLRSEIEEDLSGVLERAEKLTADTPYPPYPLFVKPANLGSSVGITKCNSRSDLVEGLIEAARFDRRVLIERGVNAREIEVSVLGNDDPQASLPGEILPSREFYSYEAKYLDGTSGLLIPAPLPEHLAEQARSLAVRAYRAVDCAGMARVDFLLDRDSDALYLNEINTIPGFTQISMYPKLWEAYGLSYPALVDRLVELALERKADRDRTERRYRKEG